MDGDDRTGGDGARSQPGGAAARSKNLRRARIALVIGGALLAAGAGLAVWDAAGDDSPAPVVITGQGG